jgi:hypothetical protein
MYRGSEKDVVHFELYLKLDHVFGILYLCQLTCIICGKILIFILVGVITPMSFSSKVHTISGAVLVP